MEIPEPIALDLHLCLTDIADWLKQNFSLTCPEKGCGSPNVSIGFSDDRRIANPVKLEATSMQCQVCGRITPLNGNYHRRQ